MRTLLLILLWCILLLSSGNVWAAAAFRSSNATTYATRTNTTITAPAGIQNGDVLLLVFTLGANSSAPTPTPPSGFALVSGTWPIDVTAFSFNVDTRVWYKIASGESGDYTVTHSSATSQGYLAAISGGSSSQPAATVNEFEGAGATAATTTALGLTTSANESLVVFISSDFGDTANALSPPTGTTPTFTERLDPGTVSGLLYVADGVLTTAGATGNKSITNNNQTASPTAWAGILVAIESSGAVPTDETFGFRMRLPQ